jgi:hypothetical protein
VSPAAAAEGRRRRRRTAERGRRRRRGAHGVEAPALLGGELLPDPSPDRLRLVVERVRPCSRTVRIRRDCSAVRWSSRSRWASGGWRGGRGARDAALGVPQVQQGGPGDDPRAKAARRASTPERWGFIA